MANHCTNRLTVIGSPAAVDAFAKHVEGNTPLDFEEILPTPSDLPDTKRPPAAIVVGVQLGRLPGYEPTDPHTWRLKHWGTDRLVGWDMRLETASDGERKTLTYTFDTAWTPPLPLCEHLAERHSRLELRLLYYESGVGFAGLAVWREGKQVVNDISDTP